MHLYADNPTSSPAHKVGQLPARCGVRDRSGVSTGSLPTRVPFCSNKLCSCGPALHAYDTCSCLLGRIFARAFSTNPGVKQVKVGLDKPLAPLGFIIRNKYIVLSTHM